MARRKPHATQVALAGIDLRERELPQTVYVDMRDWELGRLAGFFDGKNIYVDMCDICHGPGIRLRERWYHKQPCDSPCSRQSAPRPATGAMQRLLHWYQWCQGEARRYSNVEVERARKLATLIWPMETYLLSQIARHDRRHLPTVSECRMIHKAMIITEPDSFIEPLEIEAWSAKSTSSAG